MQTDIVRSADGINEVIEFQGGPNAPNIIRVYFNLTDDEVALEAVETYEVTLDVLSSQDIVQIGTPEQTTVEVLDPDGKIHCYTDVVHSTNWVCFEVL